MKTNRRTPTVELRSPVECDSGRTVSPHSSEECAVGLDIDEPCRRIGLTPRQTKVMSGIILGKTDKEIGVEMRVSHRTVSNHIAAILREMQVTTRSGAIKVLIDQHFTCPHMAQCKVRLMAQIPPDHARG